jgi:hypothetical protein
VPRRNPPRRGKPTGSGESRSGLGWAQREAGPDGDWIVRAVPGAAAQKEYRCPGCDHEIRPGTGHVVAWRDDPAGVDERRHWHSGCWRSRASRGPTPKRWY